jgi:apolipoprotein N-acyltransferase
MTPVATTRALVLAVLAGLIYWASHPPLSVGTLGFVALVPLLVAVHGGGIGRGFGLGWLAGTIACNLLTSASIFAALGRAHHPAWLAAAEAAVVPQLCGALYFGAFGAYVATLDRRRPGTPAAVFLLPAAWVGTELARSRIGHGMPWVLLAHTQVHHPRVLQVADLAGASGVSFVVALANVLGAMALVPGTRRRVGVPLALGVGVLAAAMAYGHLRLARAVGSEDPHLEVVLVQGNVPERWRATLAGLPRTVAGYRDLVARAAAGRPDLVILPENAVSVSVAANPQLLAELARPLAGTDALLLVGGPREVSGDRGRASIRNAAHLVDARGTIRGVYEKRHLVPFGEASTWLVPAFLQRRLGLRADYSAGDGAPLLDVAGTPIATLICWEGIYAAGAASLVRDGARLLVNLSNDDWFGGRAAAEQHFDATLLRAVETHRALVRVTNSGVTAVVDERGVLVAAAPRDEATILPARVALAGDLTVYTRIGDAFAWACAAVSLLAVAVPPRRSA